MREALKASVQRALRAALNVQSKEFDGRKFFTSWFRGAGQCFYFLFSKNLKVTNLQFAELHSLLRVHTRSVATKRHVRDFQLLSVDEFEASSRSLFNSFVTENTPRGARKAADLVATIYHELLHDLVCIQPFFGSCAVFFPPTLTVDLLPLCAESGYIHSCGPSILNRNVAKASRDEIIESLHKHLRGKRHATLIVYAHEDYTPHDRHLARELRDGLDDVKIHLEKYYVGKQSLVQVLQEIQMDERFAGRITIPPANHYASRSEVSMGEPEWPVIWLLVDHKPKADVRERSDAQYYVLYEQTYKNENPFHLFDENKPAWMDHTTMPHTMAAAMVNITQPWWQNKKRAPILCDPFVGTGTTLIEGMKHGLEIVGGDKEALSGPMMNHNLEFFTLPMGALRRLTAATWCIALHLFIKPDEQDSASAAAMRARVVKEYADIFTEEFSNDAVERFQRSHALYLTLELDSGGRISIPSSVVHRVCQIRAARRAILLCRAENSSAQTHWRVTANRRSYRLLLAAGLCGGSGGTRHQDGGAPRNPAGKASRFIW